MSEKGFFNVVYKFGYLMSNKYLISLEEGLEKSFSYLNTLK